jgi:hypothetical protein
MSKATVVSVCNFDIGPEYKPQLSPSHFFVPAAKPNGIAVMSFDDPIQYIPTLDYKTIVVPVPAKEVAKSIVEDWVTAQLKVENGARPGLFWVEGEYEVEDIISEYPAEVSKAFADHKQWCELLMKMGDDLWQEFRKHRHITSSMINAAAFLGEDREWSKVRKNSDFVKCPACKSLIENDASVCKVCRTIVNKSAFEALNLSIAE